MMSYPTPQVLELDSTRPRRCGQIHGELLRDQVQAMSEIRLSLMLSDTGFTKTGEVLELARAHLPVLERFDHALYEELLGIAEGSNLKPENIVVVNHYTDMRDLKPGVKPEVATDDNWDPGGCTAIFLPTQTGPVLGQTWDVHGLAMDHVLVLRIKQKFDEGKQEHQGEAIVFTVAGCLGMTGMNSLGVGITINNLNSTDARIGVVWPALVRRVLRQKTALLGRDIVMRAPLGSGHHYIVADQKNLFGVETSGTKKKITQQGNDKIHFHTNHCLDKEMAATHTIRPASTTYQRYDEIQKLLAEHIPSSSREVYEALGRVAILKNPSAPNLTATCGALVMDLAAKEALACQGPPSQTLFENPPLTLEFTS